MIDDEIYVAHILEAIRRIQVYTSGGEVEFTNSTLIQDAVLRNLQTLAESTQRLSAALKVKHKEVKWRGISGFRNVIAHDYLSVDIPTVWNIIFSEIPTLKAQISYIYANLNTPDP